MGRTRYLLLINEVYTYYLLPPRLVCYENNTIVFYVSLSVEVSIQQLLRYLVDLKDRNLHGLDIWGVC